MSTIKSSDEHLTLNADGSSKDIKFQANGVEKASISSSGAFTSTTIDATKLTGNLPAISGASLTGLPNGSQLDYSGTKTIEATSGGALIGGTAGAKNLTVESTSGAGTISLIQLKNSSDSFNIEVGRTVGALTIRDNNNGERLKLDSTGAVTMPSQPAFLAYHNATTSNLTNGDIIPFNTTIFDQNDDLHASSGVFTAPITGRYQFSFLVSVTELDASATYNRILLKCSNRTVPFGITASQMFDGSGSNDPSYYAFEGSLLLDMDANDTCKLEWNQAGGANQADAFDSTYFSGYLVC